MFPKWRQYKDWSLPSKYSLWGLLISFISLALTTAAFSPWNQDVDQLYRSVVKNRNPTKVIPVDIKQVQWLGDHEPFLTIYFKNVSKQPANSFSLFLLKGEKHLSFRQTNTSNVFNSNHLTINAGQRLGIPAAPISELRAKLSDVLRGDPIVGFGLEPKFPPEMKRKLIATHMRNGSIYYDINAYPIGLFYSYKNIFGEKIETLASFFVYIDRTS